MEGARALKEYVAKVKEAQDNLKRALKDSTSQLSLEKDRGTCEVEAKV